MFGVARQKNFNLASVRETQQDRWGNRMTFYINLSLASNFSLGLVCFLFFPLWQVAVCIYSNAFILGQYSIYLKSTDWFQHLKKIILLNTRSSVNFGGFFCTKKQKQLETEVIFLSCLRKNMVFSLTCIIIFLLQPLMYEMILMKMLLLHLPAVLV